MIKPLLFTTAAGNQTKTLTASANSVQRSATEGGRSLLVLEVYDAGSYVPGTDTIKVAARVLGAQEDGSAAYPIFLAYTVKATGVLTSGATAIQAVGEYEFDITGLEVQVQYTRGTGTGTVGFRDHIAGFGAA